jgi:hypothetical protein
MTKKHCETVSPRIFPSPRMGEGRGGGDEGKRESQDVRQ